jgi:hypothetical protein
MSSFAIFIAPYSEMSIEEVRTPGCIVRVAPQMWQA